MKNILKSKKLITVMAMVLMATMVIGMGAMTYSRYVSSANMANPETATVADWGYVLTINSADMFGTKYEDGVVNESFAATDGDKIDVTSNATAQLVAPGTEGSMTITLSGNAEVLAQITFDVADGSKDVVLAYDNDKTYSPIKWTLTKKVGTADATTIGTANTTLAAVIASLEAESAKVAAGTTVAETVYTISWSWALGELVDENNKLDTALGMLQANKSVEDIKAQTGVTVVPANSVTELSLQLSASVVQIQD